MTRTGLAETPKVLLLSEDASLLSSTPRRTSPWRQLQDDILIGSQSTGQANTSSYSSLNTAEKLPHHDLVWQYFWVLRIHAAKLMTPFLCSSPTTLRLTGEEFKPHVNKRSPALPWQMGR